jgi:hypothetical protein
MYARKVTTNPMPPSGISTRLALYHGFHHAAAIRSFQEAARLDPACAMAHWGTPCKRPITRRCPAAAEQAWAAITLAQQQAARGLAR